MFLLVIKMKRKIYEKLLEWKNREERKPLLFFGARQIGKTYIIDEFCKNEFKNYSKINLMEDDNIVSLYRESKNANIKYNDLLSYAGIVKEDENTILFIDEIQESPELIFALKYICENHPNLRIICAGSLLGIALKKNRKSFPVGKVEMLNMYQMDFEEYLMAFEENLLIKEIKECYKNNTPLMESFHNKALSYYNLYLFTGGMPEAVKDIVKNNMNASAFDERKLDEILKSYFEDMYKYVDNKNDTIKIEAIYKTIPGQLGNDSHKFQFKNINDNARKRDYEVPLSWLLTSRIVADTHNIKLPEIPLIAFADFDTFKLYMNDVGLLRKMANTTYRDIVDSQNNIFKGIMSENYVANQLMANGIENLYYYKNEQSTMEIDFLLQTDDGIIPVEVKSAENTQSKSLKSYINKFNPKYSIRISTKNFGFVNNIKSIPLYAVFCIKK